MNFGSSHVERPLRDYGDANTRRLLYQHLVGMERRMIFAAYGDSPETFAIALRHAIAPEVVRPFGEGDLRTARRFITSTSSAENAAVRAFLDTVLPTADPNRRRIPLLASRGDFREVLGRLVNLDRDYRGRVLLMRAFVILAEDHGLVR